MVEWLSFSLPVWIWRNFQRHLTTSSFCERRLFRTLVTDCQWIKLVWCYGCSFCAFYVWNLPSKFQSFGCGLCIKIYGMYNVSVECITCRRKYLHICASACTTLFCTNARTELHLFTHFLIKFIHVSCYTSHVSHVDKILFMHVKRGKTFFLHQVDVYSKNYNCILSESRSENLVN